MIRQRVSTGIILALIGLPIIIIGGRLYEALIALLLGLSAWELGRMYQASGVQPSHLLMISGAALLPLVHAHCEPCSLPFFTIWMLLSMVFHLNAYEKGREAAATDFSVSVGGMAYLGLLGIYLLDLRALPNGLWWFLLVLPIVWVADSGAYFIGRAWGKHPLSPRLSPKKTWEGYLGGIMSGLFASFLLSWAYTTYANFSIAWQQSLLLGLALPALTPLGDLAESLFKRQAGVKDSSHIFPGHGGAFDRIDSWLWAALIGYILILLF